MCIIGEYTYFLKFSRKALRDFHLSKECFHSFRFEYSFKTWKIIMKSTLVSL